MTCTCGQIVYEPGCGFGHVDQSLCEACEAAQDADDKAGIDPVERGIDPD